MYLGKTMVRGITDRCKLSMLRNDMLEEIDLKSDTERGRDLGRRRMKQDFIMLFMFFNSLTDNF